MSTPEYHVMQNGGLKWAVRPDTTDWNTYNACGPEDEYELRDEDVYGKLIFDIGAHGGGFTTWQASRGALVVALEPVPQNVEMIRANLALNGFDAIILEAAISDGEDVFVRYDFDGDDFARHHAWIGNSYRDPAPEGIGFVEDRVKGYSISELVRLYDVPDIIKIDCEGGEWLALADPAVADVRLIVGEWHPTDGHTAAEFLELLFRTHDVSLSGPEAGPGGFRATRRI